MHLRPTSLSPPPKARNDAACQPDGRSWVGIPLRDLRQFSWCSAFCAACAELQKPASALAQGGLH